MFSSAAVCWPLNSLPNRTLWLDKRAQIQSITDVSRGSIKRKKSSGADAPCLNTPCIPEDEVAAATKQLVVANHDATGPSIYHAILSDIIHQSIHNNHYAADSAVIISWTQGYDVQP